MCGFVCCLPRLNEIRVLKVRLADMRRELHVLRTGVANVDVLKREVSLGGLATATAGKQPCLQCSVLVSQLLADGSHCLPFSVLPVVRDTEAGPPRQTACVWILLCARRWPA